MATKMYLFVERSDLVFSLSVVSHRGLHVLYSAL